MSTQVNPALTAAAADEAAKKFLARVKSGEEFISKKDFETAVAKQNEAYAAELASRETAFTSALNKSVDRMAEILEAKKAPILGRNKWFIRNRFGDKVEMEYSLARIVYAQGVQKLHGALPTEKVLRARS